MGVRPAAAQPTKTAGGRNSWTNAPARTPLRKGEVHVWRVELTTVSEGLTRPLSSEERARAQRFHDTHSGEVWKRAHGILRVLLGRYLGIDPSSLRFAVGEHGKPALATDAPPATHTLASMSAPPSQPGNAASLSFNLSHSGGLALCAFARGGAVGVDVEVARRPIDELAIARRAFGSETAQRLERFEPRTREREFLRAWVRHEAAVKCLGTGIGDGEAGSNHEDLWLAELDVGRRAAAAVALERPPDQIHQWHWPPQPTVDHFATPSEPARGASADLAWKMP
jgi:4'-phosphopantetheinyl transferase